MTFLAASIWIAKRLGPLAVVLLLCVVVELSAQVQGGERPGTDAEAMSALLREAAKESVLHCTGSKVALLFADDAESPMAEQVYAEELHAAGRRVLTTEEGSECLLRIDVREMHSSTAQSMNSSYFRMTELTLGVLIEDARAGQLVWSREFALSRTDTLDGTAPYDERSWMEASPSWWESFFQPALVTLTAAVIILLLFTVRGSS